jgi:CIC family chloride channel protein
MFKKAIVVPGQLGSFIKLALARLRFLVRTNELWLIVVAAGVGAVAGLLVTLMNLIAQTLHQLIFKIDVGDRLSSAQDLLPAAAFLAPICGGLVLGVIMIGLEKWRKRPALDPIEANALHGGRLSLFDSLLVTGQNLVSNGFGASVGLEAGYTQLCSGFASWVGRSFGLRRSDLRILLGCGAAAAIGTAFNAPLTGAFYTFELIVGTYSIVTLAPIFIASLTGVFVGRLLTGGATLINIGDFGTVVNGDYFPALVLGVLSGGLGILIMQGVTLVETAARKSFIPAVARPLIGGAIVGGLALISPEVLSSGHGALHINLAASVPWAMLIFLLVLKSIASAVSIGSGFRGGLFFAALFLGAIFGKLFAFTVPTVFHTATLTPEIYAIVGMSSLAVAIIGGPLTMTFLALEMTGDFPIAALVLMAVIASSVTVRKSFGYSFATWRFHLRGESIRSAHDIGWIRTLTVGKLMYRDVRTVRDDTHLAVLRRDFPLGSAQRVVIVDHADRYAGIIVVPELYAAHLDQDVGSVIAKDLLRNQNDVLLPQMNAKEAASIFDTTESEELAVIDAPETRKVVGLLTESRTLRRYSEELDRRRHDDSGEY